MAISRIFYARVRLVVSAAAGGLALALMPPSWSLTGRLLAAWDTAAFLFLGLAWAMMAGSSLESMQSRARQDEGAYVFLGLTVIGAVASLGAIAAELAGIHAQGQGAPGLRLALVGATILGSWFFLHTVFAIHYAHDFYKTKSGLVFPGETRPDYWDFMYFSFTIGTAAQTSDVTVNSRLLRRLVLSHSILSFLFNTTILALVINVGAGFL
ncbi:DUF1345 domain-containing protein [Rhodospirillum rubrum]|uniref:Transmembrane protein n=1 Tax=Rhodospirillum rubrum (strain ATCC 11170 / ATH 1.1.1 / DSM 467 / LMG 4362 / NCIMB 8255 / S1) TaxID=269796 RepID=Q2RTM3_RHORT|nr:DUF1345 domain-containing protein [Rhodospirillum rubrum]ABC22522.1 Protein of unknown function DUF1345 [Rhodospirillum rubrum ATCC 11170]AEO48240.1 hypothetical protein F11_08870 [Rhodospirillum rubrum F11]MBK5954110.1 hypothetical protein [Rhodospirillum rubrum]QXG82151.1 DUF1345 domain-containing protein [Rhodospirillum rubrum]HAQ00520.1 DUF1345 domain-containing protein [Rhodospirillum rubrum]